jgi:hypothetical protein
MRYNAEGKVFSALAVYWGRYTSALENDYYRRLTFSDFRNYAFPSSIKIMNKSNI